MAAAAALLPLAAQATTTINLAFTPATINPGDSTSLTVQITNSALAPLTNAAVTVVLPTGISLNSNTASLNECGFTETTASTGGTTLALTAGTIPAAADGTSTGICNYTIAVRDTTPGNLSTTIPVGPAAGFTRGGSAVGYAADESGLEITNSTPTTATLSVNTLNKPAGVLSFSPGSLLVGDSGVMRVVLSNSNASATIPLTTYTQALPTGFVVSSTPGASVVCTGTGASNGILSSPNGGASVVAGDSSFTLTGGTLGTSGSCTVNLNVTPTGSTGSVTATAAANAIGNTRNLSSLLFNASITVSSPLSISQTPTGSTIVGEVTTLKITATNSSTVNALTLTSLTDRLGTGLTLDTSVTPTVVCASGVAGTLTAVHGDSTITLAGSTIAKNSTCVITVGVSADAAIGYTSDIDTSAPSSQAFTTTTPNATLAIPASSRTLTYTSPLIIAQTVGGSSIVGEVATLTITINNSSALNTLDIASLTDTLAPGMTLSSGYTPTLVCTGTGFVAGTISAVAGDSSFSISNAKAGKGGKCTITVGVTAGAIGNFSSTLSTAAPATSIATGSTPAIALSVSPSIQAVSFVSPLSITKSTTPSSGTSIRVTGVATLAITVSNASSANAMTITSLTDALPAGLVVNSAVTPTVVCNGVGFANGTLTAANGSNSITLANAVAGRSGACVITVGVSANAAGSYTSTLTTSTPATQISTATATPIALTPATTNTTLTYVSGITLAKSGPSTAYQGQSVTYLVTVSNYSAGAISNASFTDVLPTSTGNPQMTLDSGSSLGSGCSGGTFTATPGATSATWTGGTVAAPAVLTDTAPSTCTITLKAVWPDAAAVGATYRNTLPINTAFTGTDVNSVAISNPAQVRAPNGSTTASLTVGQILSPSSIIQGNTSVLTLTLTNPTAAPLTATALTDTLPANVTVAAVPNASFNCAGTAISAVPRAGSFAISGMTVPAAGSCTVSVTLSSAVVGAYSLTIPIGAVSNNEGASNSQAAPAKTLTVTTGLAATVSFAPTSTGLGGIARLGITATNNSPIALTALRITNALPTGANAFVLADTPNAASTCAGSPLITAVAGASSVAMSGATLATSGSCTLSFDIKTTTSNTSSWTHTLAVNDIGSAEGLGNTSAVNTTLTKVAAVAIGINKSFTPISILGGAPSTLRIDLSNPNTALSVANNVSLTDVFPAGMEVFSVPNASTTCVNGVISATPGDAQFSFSGADIAIGGSCSLYLDITSVKSLNLTNTIAAGAVHSQQGFTNSVQTQATLSTLQGVNVEKSFSPVAITPGQKSRLTVRLISTLNTTALTNVTLTDTLPTSPGLMVIANPPNLASTCTTLPTATIGAGSVNITGVTLSPQANCSFSVDVTAPSTGSYTNLIPVGGASSSEGFASQTAASATLNVLTAPTVGLAFTTNPVKAGAASRLTITLGNGNASALTGVALNNLLPAGLTVASALNFSAGCGATFAPTASSNTLSFTGASIPANGSCALWVDLASNTPGSYTPTVAASALVTAQGISNAAPATATLTVLQFPTVAVAYATPTLAPAATGQFTITLGNANATAITLSSALTVTLPTSPGAMAIASPNGVSKTCAGTVTATAGAASFSYASGSAIPAGGCSISVNITASVDGTYTQTTPAGSLQTSAGNQQSAASASIAVSNNTPPTAANLQLTLNNNAATPVSVGTLSGTPQAPATISSYTLTSVPASKAVVYCAALQISSADMPYDCGANLVKVLPVAAPSGSTTFTYVANDSNALSSVPATITVNFNTAPTATPVTSSAILATATSAQPLAAMAGSATGATLTAYTVTTLPATGTLYCNGAALTAGALPSACAANGLGFLPSASTPNPLVFAYTVTDSNGMVSAPASYTIPLLAAPTASALSATINYNASAAVSIGPLLGTPSGSATLGSYSITTLPASATVYCSGTAISSVPAHCAAAALTVLPVGNPTGSSSFSYTVTDNNGLTSAPALVTLNWNTRPLASSATSSAVDQSVTTAQPVTPLLGSATTTGATVASFTVTSLPASGTLYCSAVAITTLPADCASNGLGYLPGASYVSAVSFTFTVTDSIGLVSLPATITIPLTGAADLVIAKTSSGPMTVGFDALYTLQVRNTATAVPSSGLVTVTDTLPASLDYQSASGVGATSDWTCSYTAGTRLLSCTSTAAIAAHGSAQPIALQVKPNATAIVSGSSGNVSNTASVSGGGMAPGQSASGSDTQSVGMAAIVSGASWVDLNHNGVHDAGEPLPQPDSVRVEVWPAGTTAAQAASGTPIASALIGASGSYSLSVPAGNVQIRFADVSSNGTLGQPVNGAPGQTMNGQGVNQATGSSGVISHGVIDNVGLSAGATVVQQSLPIDPQGVVYDSGTRQPIGGATVTLRANGSVVSTTCLAGGANPFVTASSGGAAGSYQFLVDFAAAGCGALSGSTFTLSAVASGYSAPSAQIPAGSGGVSVLSAPVGSGVYAVVPNAAAPTGADPTTHYLAIVLASNSKGVVNNHIPMDGSSVGALVVSKQASRSTAELGDTVRYTITLRNTGNGTLPFTSVSDQLPLGFKLLGQSAVWTQGGSSQTLATTSPGPLLTFGVPGLAANTSGTLHYVVRLGVGADRGDGVNRVSATAGTTRSNEARATVKVGGGVFGTDACVLGKVFMDCNDNGLQDAGEAGVAGVRLVLESGWTVVTDSEGKFSLCGLPPRTHGIKLDSSTLPAGMAARITSHRNLGDPGSLLLDLKNGELARADFAVGQCTAAPQASHDPGAATAAQPPGRRIIFESPDLPAQGGAR